MDNLLVYVILAIAIIALLFFVIRKNNKDRKELEQQLNEDYKKTKDEEGDIDADIDRDSKL